MNNETAPPAAETPEMALISNLAMMIRRLAYAVKRHGGHEIMVSQAVKLLKDNGLNGNILRDEYTEGGHE